MSGEQVSFVLQIRRRARLALLRSKRVALTGLIRRIYRRALTVGRGEGGWYG